MSARLHISPLRRSTQTLLASLLAAAALILMAAPHFQQQRAAAADKRALRSAQAAADAAIEIHHRTGSLTELTPGRVSRPLPQQNALTLASAQEARRLHVSGRGSSEHDVLAWVSPSADRAIVCVNSSGSRGACAVVVARRGRPEATAAAVDTGVPLVAGYQRESLLASVDTARLRG